MSDRPAANQTPPGPIDRTGPLAALAAAALFGASTPLAKLLVGNVGPVMLAGLLYSASGVALGGWIVWRRLRRSAVSRETPLSRAELPWLMGAIMFGGVLAPVLLMLGLTRTDASTASLLLNLEGVFTALLAWFVFRENFDRRIALGMFAILCGGIVITWSGAPRIGSVVPPLMVVGACLGWAIDNNLTRRVAAADPVEIAAIKGLVGGAVNTTLAFALGARIPSLGAVAGAGVVGILGYGLSLVLFILALRHVGSARTGAYFSTAPFIGAVVSVVLLRDPITASLVLAGALMGVGVWLHLTERHEHVHTHAALEHDHAHVHDEHHQHSHTPTDPPGEPHRHSHRHEPMVHSHAHYPDIHHRHEH